MSNQSRASWAKRWGIPGFAIFYALSICGLAVGVYLVAAYSLYRIIVLYCLFNIIFFWITAPQRKESSQDRLRISGKTSFLLALSTLGLLAILFVSTIESLYVRPFFMPPTIYLIIVLMAIIVVASTGVHDNPVLMSVLLLTLIMVVIFVNFSIYIVQPDILTRPLYATVDAYRDYANAARILDLSTFHANEMVLERYYSAFPIIPLQISMISLVGGLPISDAHLLLAMIIETNGVVCMWLLSTAVIRRVAPALAPSAVLATLLVWLQPYLIDPAWILTPSRLAIPSIVLVFYLVYRNLTKAGPASRPVLISILILLLPAIPTHATDSIFLVVIFVTVGFLVRRSRHLAISLAAISIVYLFAYLLSAAATPLNSLLEGLKSMIAAIAEILSGGSSHVTEIVLGASMNVHQSEFDLFTQALPLAIVLSMFTICIVRSRSPAQGLEDRRLSSLHLACGVFAIVGFGAGFLLPYFHANVDMRYFVFPLTSLALVACAVVIGAALRNGMTSRMKGLILIAVVALYAVSMTSSPLFFHETSPNYARLIPTESESAAARFVSKNVQEGIPTRIATDFPFHSDVKGLLYSRIGIEQNIVVSVGLYSDAPDRQTIVILRQYFLDSNYLRSYHVSALDDVDRWNSPRYNRIFDSYSTSVYLGTQKLRLG